MIIDSFCFSLMQVIPCAVLSLIIHPTTQHHILNRISWAFCVYLEAVSVLPQLRVMQNTKVRFKVTHACPISFSILMVHRPCHFKLFYFKLNFLNEDYFFLIYICSNPQIVEPFTAHYVFALGVARFLSCAHWVLQVR